MKDYEIKDVIDEYVLTQFVNLSGDELLGVLAGDESLYDRARELIAKSYGVEIIW